MTGANHPYQFRRRAEVLNRPKSVSGNTEEVKWNRREDSWS